MGGIECQALCVCSFLFRHIMLYCVLVSLMWGPAYISHGMPSIIQLFTVVWYFKINLSFSGAFLQETVSLNIFWFYTALENILKTYLLKRVVVFCCVLIAFWMIFSILLLMIQPKSTKLNIISFSKFECIFDIYVYLFTDSKE